MRILLAGATGALGRRLLPLLVDAGHDVVGTTRSAANTASLQRAGVEPAVMDGLDAESVTAAMTAARPDAVIHQLSSLSGASNLKKFDATFAATNALRTRGTDLLLAAAVSAGAKRFIAQSYTGWPNERTGSLVKDEADPLDSHPTKASRQTLDAIKYVEQVVTSSPDLHGTALRYGTFYGPGTGFQPGGEMYELIRKRQLPLVGTASGIWSWIHIDDAARATMLALERGAPGVYNITDDEPAPVSEWLPHLAAAIGAKPPRRLPAWLVRPMIGEHGISLMTQIRGSSNAKAKRELGWTLEYPSWRSGFESGLGDPVA